MYIYKYFFSKLQRTFSRIDNSSEHTALLLLSHSILFYLLSMFNFFGVVLKVDNVYFWFTCIISLFVVLYIHYFLFIKDDKFKAFSFKNSAFLNFLLILYLFFSFFLFFYSLYSLSRLVELDKNIQ